MCSLRVQETALRLINVLAGLSAGRTYLLQDQRLVPSLIKTMCATPNDTSLRQNALGCLQKFSLRRVPQSTMIEAGVIEWILTQLSNHVKGVCASALCGELGTVCMRVFSACVHMCMFVSQHALVLPPAVPSARGGLSLQVPCLCLLMVDSLPWVWFVVLSGINPPLSEYTVEYSTALLMNLCLRKSGKLKAASSRVGILRVLCEYLESDDEQVRTYINGTLYSVLALPVLKVCFLRRRSEPCWSGVAIASCGAVRSAASKALLGDRVATT